MLDSFRSMSFFHLLKTMTSNVSIQAIKQWCALHKSDKHSDADCGLFAQQEILDDVQSTWSRQESQLRADSVHKLRKDTVCKPRRLPHLYIASKQPMTGRNSFCSVEGLEASVGVDLSAPEIATKKTVPDEPTLMIHKLNSRGSNPQSLMQLQATQPKRSHPARRQKTT